MRSSLLLGGLWLLGGAPAFAACTLTGNGAVVQCDSNRIYATAISGDVTLTIDSMILAPGANAEIDFYPQGGIVFPPVNATLIITGTTTVNTLNYGAVNFAVAVANYSLNLQVGTQVVLQSGGGFGGLWVRNDISGAITINTAATVTVTGADEDGVHGTTNLGSVYLNNAGAVISTAGRGLYADGGCGNAATDPVPVTIINSGTVDAFMAGIRAIDYQGLALIDNSGSVESTTRQGLVAWSNNGPVAITNTGIVISHDDSAIHAMSEIGDIVVTNGGTVTAANDPMIMATRDGYSGIRAAVTTSGNIAITNARTGSVTANDDAAIVAQTPSGDISIINRGSLTGRGGVDASTANGAILLINSGSISAVLDAVHLAGSRNLLDNSGTITTSGPASHAVLTGDGDTLVINSGVISNSATSGVAIAFGAGSNRLVMTDGAIVTAASGWAVSDGPGSLVLTSRGTILGNITAGPGNDQVFLEAGSRTAGIVYLGADNDLAVVRAGADIGGVTLFSGEGGSDTLRFEGVTRTGGADVAEWERFELTQGSRFTLGSDLVMGGSDTRTGTVAIDATSTLAAPGNRTIRAIDPASPVTVTNAGLIAIATGSAAGNTLTIAGHYVGQGGAIALNAALGSGGVSDRLVISGGRASGDTGLRIALAGGAATAGDSVRVVETVNGATTDPGAFRLGARVAAGSFEYQLFRGGSASAEDWFLRSADAAGVPLYRPEAALYAPAPAAARRIGLATLATLDARIGEGLDGPADGVLGKEAGPPGSGAWARVIGERSRSRWDGTVDAAATANLVGLQAGFDILRTEPYAGGHRDHAGVYVAYTDTNAPGVSGFALGQQRLRVGRLQMSGPTIGAYWTHFGPSGWYLDAVVQANWFDVTARSDYGAGLSTNGTGTAASLEAGYPIRFGQGWQIEPQAQIVWQSVSVDRSRDTFSSVDWDAGDAVTGRLGARVQYTGRSAEALWRPYAKVNLWHGFSGTDRIRLGASAPIESRYGDTALEVGAGITARVSRTTSFYAHADYRWSLDGGRSRQTATQGSIGIRVNW